MLETPVKNATCPRCSFELATEQAECPACGIVFARYEEAQRATEREFGEGADEGGWSGGVGDVAGPGITMPPGGYAAMSLPEPLEWVATLNNFSGVVNLLLAGGLYYLSRFDPTVMSTAFYSVAVAGLSFWVAWATRRLYPSARIVLVIGSCFSLLAVPLGTLMSILLLRYLFHPGMPVLFSGKQPHELTEDEAEKLIDLRDSQAGIWFVRVTKFLLFLGVLGILAALAFGGLLGLRGTFKEARAVGELMEIDFAVRDNVIDGHAGFPPTQSVPDLARNYEEPPPFIDPWGKPYRYERISSGFRVGSAGPDGKWERPSLAYYDKGKRIGDDLVLHGGRLLWK